MTLRKTNIAIGVSHRSEQPERDRHGNAKHTFSDFQPEYVYLIAPSSRTEPTEQGRSNAVLSKWDIYGPLSLTIGPYDRVKLPDGTITEVVGEVGRWDHNPHSLHTTQHTCVEFTVERRQG